VPKSDSGQHQGLGCQAKVRIDGKAPGSGANPVWTVIRRQAGFVGDPTADEALLSKAVSRMLHIDDPLRVRTYTEWLSQPGRGVDGIDEMIRRLLAMLHFDLWSSDNSSIGLRESLARLF
jgi:hypothetical protein